ncbi:hypothetical protein, partial [Amphritea sp.]|uniref:hypothetical protein n=1 Tax=Amphritea sp. TaxID=1872502 RepID=UPI003561F7DD
ADIDGAVTAESLSVTGVSDITADITTTGTQDYTGAVILSNDVVLSGTQVTTNAVSGPHNLTVTGNADMKGAVSVSDLSVSGDATFASTVAASAISIGGTADIDGAVTAESLSVTGASDIAADITTTGTQDYSGAVTLSNDVMLAASSVSTGAVSGGYGLNVAGNADFGSTVDIKGLSVSGNASFADRVNTEDLTVGADAVFASAVEAQSIVVTGDTELFDNVTTGLTQTFTGAVTLNNDLSLSGSDIAIGSVDGGHALIVNSQGNFVTGDIGQHAALMGLTVDAVNGYRLQSVSVNGDVALNSGGNISSNQVVEVSGELTLNTDGDVAFNNAGNDFNTLTVQAENASLHDRNSIVLNGISTTVNLTVTATDRITDNGHISVMGLATFKADNEINLGTWGDSELTRFGQLAVTGLNQSRALKASVIEDDSMQIAAGAADELTLISETGNIVANSDVTLDVFNNLRLEVLQSETIGTPNNPLDFTFAGDYSSSTLNLIGSEAYLTTQAGLLSGRLITSGSSVIFRSALTDTALSASMIDFLNYLFATDEALFNEFVIIFDVKNDGVLLPEDQKDDIFAYLERGGESVGYVRKIQKFKQLFDLWEKYDNVFTLTVPQRDIIAAG